MVLAGSWDGSLACRQGSECCLPNNRVAGSPPAYRIDSQRPRPTAWTPVTGNALKPKDGTGQRVSPVIPSVHAYPVLLVSDLTQRNGRLLGCSFSFSSSSFFFFFFFFFNSQSIWSPWREAARLVLSCLFCTSMGTRKPTGCLQVSLKYHSEVLDQENWGGSQCIDLLWALLDLQLGQDKHLVNWFPFCTILTTWIDWHLCLVHIRTSPLVYFALWFVVLLCLYIMLCSPWEKSHHMQCINRLHTLKVVHKKYYGVHGYIRNFQWCTNMCLKSWVLCK